MANCRYNLDTANSDLIQIDLNSWRLVNNVETVHLTLVNFSEPDKPVSLSIPVCKADLKHLRDKLSEIID